jgi:hypothetical protein
MTNDDSIYMRALAAKRNMLQHKIHMARAMQRKAAELEREALAEMAELDVATKVLNELPKALESAQNHDLGWNHYQIMAEVNERAKRISEEADQLGESLYESKRQKDIVVFHCVRMLADGSYKTTEELLQGLLEQNVRLTAANPLQRLSQILSADDRFRPQRGKGWSMNMEPRPNPPDILGVDENLRLRARRHNIRADDGSAR